MTKPGPPETRYAPIVRHAGVGPCVAILLVCPPRDPFIPSLLHLFNSEFFCTH